MKLMIDYDRKVFRIEGSVTLDELEQMMKEMRYVADSDKWVLESGIESTLDATDYRWYNPYQWGDVTPIPNWSAPFYTSSTSEKED